MGRSARWIRVAGFTLLELLVVLAIIAIGSAGVAFAMRDGAAAALERDGQRLAALLESGRARSRTTGVPVRWRAVEGGFKFDGVPAGALPERWLSEATRPLGNPALLLGPEPVIGRQAVTLGSTDQPERRITVSTDGLRPFAIAEPGAP